MFLTRANPKGGRPLEDGSYPYVEDPTTHDGGFKVGYLGKCDYCGKGGGEPILLHIHDAENIANRFGGGVQKYRKLVKQMIPKCPLRVRLARWLLGRRKADILTEELERELPD